MNDDTKKQAPNAGGDAPKPANDDQSPWAAEADDPAPANASTDDADGANAELEQLRAENEDLKNRVLRAMADMENLRRRTEREKQDSGKYAISRFAQDIVSVADNLTRAIESLGGEGEDHSADSVKNMISGVEMTERELQNVLSRHGVTKLDPMGEKFDPNFHEAMFEIENKDVPSGSVIQVVQVGYQIGERVLRPARVGVARGGPKAEAPAPEPAATEETAASPEAAQPEPAQPGAEGTASSGDMGHTVDKTA